MATFSAHSLVVEGADGAGGKGSEGFSDGSGKCLIFVCAFAGGVSAGYCFLPLAEFEYFLFSPGFEGNLSLLDICIYVSRGLNQMEVLVSGARTNEQVRLVFGSSRINIDLSPRK